MNAVSAVRDVLLYAGTSWVLWLLGVLSVASFVVIVERWLFYRSRRGDLPQLAHMLDERLSADEVEDAIRELGATQSVAASIAGAGLRLAHRSPGAVDKAMQSATALERDRLERRLSFLGTLGNNAPFVGLFGTVVGVVHAFASLHETATQHGMHSGMSSALMGSVSEALVSTAVGILVALPAVFAYNYFQREATSLLSGSDVLSNLVLAYLADDKGA